MNKYKITFEGYTCEHKLGMNTILQSCPHIKVLEIDLTRYIIIHLENRFGEIILDTLKNADCLQAEEVEEKEE